MNKSLTWLRIVLDKSVSLTPARHPDKKSYENAQRRSVFYLGGYT